MTMKLLKSRFVSFLTLPIRLLFDHKTVNKLGLKSIRDERYDTVIKFCKGKTIDIGCGNNGLIRRYKNGVGVDVYDFGGGATIVKDTAKLPFKKGEFQTAAFVACFNHIPNRKEVVDEMYRILDDDGRIVMTMITPLIGLIRHKLAWWDEDQHERGMEEEEDYGLTKKHIVKILRKSGFKLVKHKGFILGLNNLYVFKKVKKN